MKLSKAGRSFESGRPLDLDLRRAIVDEIVALSGDLISGYFPGCYHYQTVATKFRVSRSTVRKIWERFCTCTDLNEKPKAVTGGNPSNLSEEDLELIEVLKHQKSSMSLREIYDVLDELGDCGDNTSISAVSRAIKNRLPSGSYSRKKITHFAKERFTTLNMIYSQLFIDYLKSKNPYRLKFFDESGFKLPYTGIRNYGHSLVGARSARCLEVTRKCQSPNLTLNLLTSLYDGVAYYNIVDGPTNTIEFLNFFTDALGAVSLRTGRPVLECGDIVIMDNLNVHHYEGGEILEDVLHNIGAELLYTPIYSPDLNPAECFFSKLKTVLKYDLQDLVSYDLKVALQRLFLLLPHWMHVVIISTAVTFLCNISC